MLNRLTQIFRRDPKPDTPAEEIEGEDDDSEDGDERVYARDEKDSLSWIGVGLDGVLSERRDDGLAGEIGPPIPDMVARVRDWVKYKRIRVRILTPRAATPEGAEQVSQWVKKHRLDYLEFTSQKDLHMVEFWDDRAVQVISNLGVVVGQSPNNLDSPPEPEAQNADGENKTEEKPGSSEH